MLKIQNRRYIGSKVKLLKEIEECVETSGLNIDKPTFADLFAGTGVVAYEFAKKGYKIIVNDILYSNFVSYKAWFSEENINRNLIEKTIKEFNNLIYEDLQPNYFSDVYGDKYFSHNDAKKIGYIRDYIEEHKQEYSEREYFYLLTSLMYATDKIANTVGHFEHFLKKKPVDTNFKMQFLELEELNGCAIFNEDSNALIKKIKCDVLYIDPPYNARQYVNFYHVLENLASWKKPSEFEGTSMKFKRNHLKSGYSRSIAGKLMKDLIDNADCSLIVVSYNNTYNARSNASNNKIAEEELREILKSKGTVSVKEIEYQFFNSGKTDFNNHLEKIYVCKVSK